MSRPAPRGSSGLMPDHPQPHRQATLTLVPTRPDPMQDDRPTRRRPARWMGFSTSTLDALCRHLHDRFGVVEFTVQPSARKPRAIRAYEEVGSRRLDLPVEASRAPWGPSDYADSVDMVWSMPPEGDGADRP